MRPENMHYYRDPRIQKPTPETESADALYIQSLLSDLIVLDGNEHTILSNCPVRFEQLQTSLPNTGSHARAVLNPNLQDMHMKQQILIGLSTLSQTRALCFDC